MKRVFSIYEAVNRLNGKRYVGATSRGLNVRRSKHFSDAKAERPGCRVFNAAIRKYGANAFDWRVLVTASSHAEMMKEEVRLIAELNPEYNITSGGHGVIGVKRTPEWLAKTSAALKGRRPSPQCYAAIDWTKRFKSIVCLDDGLFFDGIKVAAAHYGVSARGIGEMLHGRQTKCGGVSFAYSNKPLSKTRRKLLLSYLVYKTTAAISGRKSRAVVCISDDTFYRSAVSAARVYEISSSRVMQLCQGAGSTQSGLAFQYADRFDREAA